MRVLQWDTAGQERFRTITSSYYRGAHGILLVFDMTEANTFQECATWLEEIRSYANPGVKVVLVGNKVDKAHARCVTTEEAKAFAEKKLVGYAETSALSGENVDMTFRSLAEALLESDYGVQQGLEKRPSADE